MLTFRKQLRGVDIAGGTIGRHLVTIDSEPVVLFEKSHPILKPKFTSDAWDAFASQVQLQEADQMLLATWNRHNRFAFNCHTLAIGAPIGVEPTYWLEGSASMFTLAENPAQNVLNTFFSHQRTSCCWDQLRDVARRGDILVYRERERGDLTHSGVLHAVGEKLCLLSKLGEYPVTISRLDAIEEEYRGQFDCLDLYERRPLGRRSVKRPQAALAVPVS